LKERDGEQMVNGEWVHFDTKRHQSAFHSRSTGVPQKGQPETMTDNTDIEFKKENSFKNNV
jgi:hypothetical protein